MNEDILKKVYHSVDSLLASLRDNGSGSLYDLGDDLYETTGQMAKSILVEHNLISFQKGYVAVDSVIDITTNGLKVLKMGGIEKFLVSLNQSVEERENLELQQLRTNVQILTNQHIDYLKDRKRFVRNEWAMWIGILLSIIALIISLTN